MHSVISDLPADLGPEIVSYPPDLIKAVRHGEEPGGHVCRVDGGVPGDGGVGGVRR